MKFDVKVGCSLCVLALFGMGSTARAQTQLPQVVIKQAAPVKRAAPVRRVPRHRSASPAEAARSPVPSTAPSAASATSGGAASAASAAGPQNAPAAASPAATAETQFAASRDQIMTKTGANSTSLGRDQIEALPLGDNQPVDKVVLQTPGVAQDSAASGSLHVRNEHANVQTRINGILLPDGVSGFDQFLSTSFIGHLALVTGALPAEYGFHTAGLLDVTTRNGAFDNTGSVTLFGGSRGTISPSFEYGAIAARPIISSPAVS